MILLVLFHGILMQTYSYVPDIYLFNVSGPGSFNILEGHSKATMLLIFNNAAQGILSSFFFKYAGSSHL
jgi:hypothetical protein